MKGVRGCHRKMDGPRGPLEQSVLDPMSSYIVGLCICTETMALNGYIDICILWQELSNWSPIYSLG